MKINKIKKLAGGKYKIELEDLNLIIYEDVMLEENILYKKELDEDIIDKLTKKNDYYTVYNKTLKYIMTKIRSEKEIKEYLKKFEINENDKDKIITKLKSIRLINDDVYLKSYISDRVRLSNDGPKKIKNNLIQNNIDGNKIDLEMEQYQKDFEDKLTRLILKKTKVVKESEYMMKQKLTNHFINLGYSKNMIENILNTVKIDSSSIIKSEYNKQLKRLSNKYDGEELKYKIKNNLYKKGYKIDEINKVIE